jgi:hypothetical protein
MVTKSFDWIDEVRAKLSQDLKTRRRNSKECVIETSAKWRVKRKREEMDLKVRRKKLSGCFRKRAT